MGSHVLWGVLETDALSQVQISLPEPLVAQWRQLWACLLSWGAEQWSLAVVASFTCFSAINDGWCSAPLHVVHLWSLVTLAPSKTWLSATEALPTPLTTEEYNVSYCRNLIISKLPLVLAQLLSDGSSL
jgi:hypothetical protein